MKNIKLTIAYEGSRYLGWQKNVTGTSIEEELERSISQIVRHPITLSAASRTDAGVHAAAQVANFFTESPFLLKNFIKGSMRFFQAISPSFFWRR